MTLPVSIGDAILLSTLAFRLGHAFTSGRKSAPDEFQEVQNQLFSLGKALEVLASCRKMAFKVQDDNEITTSQSGEPEQHDDVIALMVSNCRTTLHHLELIVDKYTELKRDAKKPEPVGGKRWREELKQNWKKLRWTTEGGDVDKLRGNLNVHINGLNLAISAINSSQTKNVEKRVDEVHRMLDEVHVWFTANLKSTTTRAASTPESPTRFRSSSSAETGSQLPPAGLTFTVSELPQAYGQNSILCCTRATFHPRWDTELRPFQCRCQQNDSIHTTNSALSREIHEEQLHYLLSPISLLIRLVGPQPTWQLAAFSPTPSRIISLLLSGVNISRAADFQYYSDQLAIFQSRRFQQHGTSSMMIQSSANENSEVTISLLNLMKDMSRFRGQISSVTFIANGHRYTQGSIEGVHLLQYKSVPWQNSQDLQQGGIERLWHQCQAELILQPSAVGSGLSDDQEVSRLILHIEHGTMVTPKHDEGKIGISGVLCIAEKINGVRDIIESVDVELEFMMPGLTWVFEESLRSMQEELLILRHQSSHRELDDVGQSSTTGLMLDTS